MRPQGTDYKRRGTVPTPPGRGRARPAVRASLSEQQRHEGASSGTERPGAGPARSSSPAPPTPPSPGCWILTSVLPWLGFQSLLTKWAAILRLPVHLFQEGGPLPGPESGSCLTLGNELSEETHVLTKQELLLGKGTRARAGVLREPGRTALPCGLQSRVLLLVSGLYLANLSDSESFLVAQASLSQGGCQRGFWEAVGHMVSPSDLS